MSSNEHVVCDCLTRGAPLEAIIDYVTDPRRFAVATDDGVGWLGHGTPELPKNRSGQSDSILARAIGSVQALARGGSWEHERAFVIEHFGCSVKEIPSRLKL
jgi:hypothetical protein